MNTFKQIVVGLALSLGLISLAPVAAMAQVGATVNTTVTTPGASASSSTTVKLGANETKAIAKADQEIDRRVAALNDLNTRVQSMQRITEQFKTSLNAALQAQISAFSNLKAKIDADTDVATLKVDIKSITESYRVFALVIPQGRIAAAADRTVVLVDMMSILGSKLQARIQAAAQAGNDTTAVTAALTDMSAKLNEASSKAQAAVTASASLSPDNGDKTIQASNDAALKGARADLQTAIKDLQAARKDAATILTAMAKFTASASTSASTTTTTP